MKLKIIQFICDMGFGGAQAILKDYARLIDHQKYEMSILTIYPVEDKKVISLMKECNVSLISIYPNHSFINKVKTRVASIFFISHSLSKLLSQQKPNVIHCHLGVLRYFDGIYDKLSGVKIFYTCHSLPLRLFDGENRVEYKAAIKLFAKCNFRLIGLHEEMKNELDKLFKVNDTLIIRNGVNFERFKSSTIDCIKKRKELSIDKDSFVVGHVGRFAYMKNHKFLVDVFKRITEIRDNAILLLIGDGPLLDDIKRKVIELNINDRVIFLGNRTDIPELLSIMDIFVFPSMFEGLPVSIVEAQVAGLRCVVSDTITKDCFFLPSLVPINLNLGINTWADVIIDDSAVGPYDKDITSFDMNKEIFRLEKLYEEKK